ncbi:MAG: formimidoylglutamate deiminase [Sphingomonadales bacterium]
MSSTNQTMNFKTALLEDGWATNVSISSVNGLISELIVEGVSRPEDYKGIAIPAMHNLHSHAFQRAFAGLAENWSGGGDDFWSWRSAMYSFLKKMTPKDIEAISSQLYVELLKEGYVSVGEFHYLHHGEGGKHFPSIAETSNKIFMGADNSGIALCHLPVLYQTKGFDGGGLGNSQLPFYNNNQSFMEIFESCLGLAKDDINKNVGVAFHSLRAVSETSMKSVQKSVQKLCPKAPIHIHIAEQTKEVLECLGEHSQRPVKWLLDNFEVGDNWCLVHATHMTDEETKELAKTCAIAGICPTTEANLGDGIFPSQQYLNFGGFFGIGSDSHIGRDPREELRLFEYAQRLIHQRRGILGNEKSKGIGRFLWENAALGGAQALGFNSGVLKVGTRADIAVLNENSPQIYGKKGDAILDGFVFLSGQTPVKDVYVAGKKTIENGFHTNENDIFKNYKTSIDKLMDG